MYLQAGDHGHAASGGAGAESPDGAGHPERGPDAAGGTPADDAAGPVDDGDFGAPRPSATAAFLASPPGILAAVTALVSVLLTAASLVLGLRLPPGWVPEVPALPDHAAGLAFPLAGVFLLVNRAPAITGWLMCAGGLGCAVRVFCRALMLSCASAGDLTAAGYLTWVTAAGLHVGALLLAVLLPLYSPDGRLPSARWRPIVVAASAVAVAQTALVVIRPTPPPEGYPWPRVIPNPLAVEVLAPSSYSAVHMTLFTVIVLFVVTAMASQVVRFRRADAAGRRQVAWPLSAFAGYIVFLVAGAELWLPAAIWTGLIPVTLVFAALRYRLYGIDTVISRAFVAAGLLAAVSVVYFGAGTLAGLVLSGYDRVGGLVAALAAGVFFQPLRDRLRRLVDRLMYGTHGDPALLAARLAREVGEAEPAGALAAVAAAIRDGLGVTGVAVEVDDPGARRVELGRLGPGPRVVRLVWHGEPVGRLLLGAPGPRRFAAAYNDRLIAVVAPYVADVVHAIRMTADLQRSRERILTAREEERRRLRRDLHDGLGHALADMAMSINMARISLRTAPASADRLLLGLRAGMDSVSQEIRELVYGLRPPTLDELGLAGAVRALAAEGGLPVAVEASGDLSDLPAAAEVAAYRIAQEALTNVRKHAGARSATVALRREDSSLTVRVTDDGRGLPAGARSGIGLISMRERATELGGTCAVGPVPGGGTAVEAVLPLGG
ncbi:sensor histidine kinase [Planomonospora sp. ID67723]|uniref:sensor histidine kinase n=1 Tax=Planomonospora sp. ID67723 TaxID=2738134 RepID=UPI0018C3FA7C|nr:sensor histidine kinase [Planomonospora sp. ID67723]MBG0829292.1 sensor histidine kinase [Planomonospora sp. ID67723]